MQFVLHRKHITKHVSTRNTQNVEFQYVKTRGTYSTYPTNFMELLQKLPVVQLHKNFPAIYGSSLQSPAYLWSRVIHLPWICRWYVLPKRRLKPDPHVATSQKTIFSNRLHSRRIITIQFSLIVGRHDSYWLRTGIPRDRGWSPYRGYNFLFSMSSRLALGFTKPSIHLVPGALSSGV
jgi:hypothetical protein